MKYFHLYIILVFVVLSRSLCLSQARINSTKDIYRHSDDLKHTLKDTPPHKKPGTYKHSRSKNINHQQLQHNSSPQQTISDSDNIAWLRHYGSGVISYDDIARAIATDTFGNVYVTGSSYIAGTFEDYETIKYSAGGDTVWVRGYNGTGNNDDGATAIKVDRNGNVYVTGYSYSDNSQDYVTIKYNTNGDTIWSSRYIGPGDTDDLPTALAIDSAGNVYVTGYSNGDVGGSTDYTTIKYDAEGDTVWVRQYRGPADSDDKPAGIAVDDSGNVFVTGYSDYFYLTIKYDANGGTAWTRWLGSESSDNKAKGIAIDRSGNVYVTGNSYDAGTYYDYATIKYNASGDTKWVRYYNGPGNEDDVANSLAVDDSGNVFVTGYSKGSVTDYDYTTIKYNANGDTAWVQRYDGSGNSDDKASALVLDNLGNVYVTGYSTDSTTYEDYVTIKYDGSGNIVWANRYNGEDDGDDNAVALALDNIGNVCVTGTSNADYVTIKYGVSGDLIRADVYRGPGNSFDYAKVVKVDVSGNVYVAGSGLGMNGTKDYVTIKYNAHGDTNWVQRYHGMGQGDNELSALALDDSGNVFVTGTSHYGYATIKYNSNGDTIWVRRYEHGEAIAIAVDGSGNVYVTGSSDVSGTGWDFTTIKYKANGDTVWVRRYNGSGLDNDLATALAIDGVGNVYVTGYNDDYVTIKYNEHGDTAWVRQYNGPGHFYDRTTALAIDGSGSVYITGYSAVDPDNPDYNIATIKYFANGDTAWVRRYYKNSFANALAVDSSGNVYVTGQVHDHHSPFYYDYITIKYNASGDTDWVRLYNEGNDVANALALDRVGNVYVTGYSFGSNSYKDYATIKYLANGETDWVRRYSDPGNDDEATALAVDGSGNVYVTGSTQKFSLVYKSLFTTIKYTQTPDGVIELPFGVPTGYKLEQNYPNPFNPTTNLSFVIGHSSLVSLRVFDIVGKEVATLLNNRKYEIGSYEIPFDASGLASGVYFYRIEATGVDKSAVNFIETKKLLLVR